uniref:Uncharacterized protein n=1 Tax=Amphimedon queenslandica TaxID=400682 RepID=A0A1X7TSV5_AMPQE
QWIVPSVSGQCCPPTDSFIIERISPNKGIMYGGLVSHGGISIPTNSIYLFQLSHCNDSIIINWEILKPGAIPIDGVWPKERCAHASTIIHGVSTSPTLVVIGGMDHRNELVKECLLLDTNQYNWMKIPLPDSVTGRYYHTVSSFVLDPNHVFLIIVGGDVESMDWINRRVPDPLITMLIELVFNDGQWSVGPVLDSFNIPLWYELILKERRKEYMTNKVKELQVINESLCHDLQVARINNQSLQEALLALESEKSMLETHLLETKTLLTKRKRDQEDSPNSDNVKKLKTDELVKEKQIMTDEDNEKLRATVAYNEVYITEIEEEKKQVEEQYLDLKSTVADNERYTAKLMKEKEQLQERVTSLEEQSIKKTTSTKEVQFDYTIPSMDNLECLSDVQVAEKKLFLIQGDKPQLMNWEKYGLRIGVQEGSLLSFETVEAAVVALVGGQFEFPPNTVLVSAVYAVSLSKPLLKQLKLEIQHCVDLTGRPDLAQYLKFAIAPVSTPSLPYQFSIVEGGEFSSDSSYGSINRIEFCLVCVCGECNGGDEGGGGGGTTDNLPFGSTSSADPISVNSSYTSDVNQQLGSNSASVLSQLSQSIKYAGLFFYEEKSVEDLVTFTAAKKLNALLEFIEKKHPQAKLDLNVYFGIASSDSFVELNLNGPQDELFTGWSIKPRMTPCRLYQDDINNFGDKDYPLPPSCPISVYGSPGAVPTLNYSVPLEGVVRPVTICIHASLKTTNPTTSFSSNTITEATASSTGGASVTATVDVERVKRIINDVLVSRDAALNSLISSLSDLASQLFSVGLITDQVKRTCSMETFITEFKSSINFKRKLSEVQEHCQKFLSSFVAVRGSYADAAIALGEDWIEAIRNELGFDFNINIDT